MTDQNFKTSFIPTKPIQPISKGGGLGVSSGNFLNIITLVIFLISIAASGGVFAYKILLQKNDEKGIKALEEAKQTFNIPLVNEADKLNSRIMSVKVLLNNHLSPSKLFDLLESHTLKTIQFNNLSIIKESDGTFKISATGIANRYNDASGYEAIILQSKEYSSFLQDVLFTGVQPTQQGSVSFILDAKVDKKLIEYKNKIEDSNIEINDDETSDGESFEFPDQTDNSN
jgi:uncharacterized membrane protein